MVSPIAFSHIFGDQNMENIDSKLKTTLLIIKKDFDLNPAFNYAPLIFKPRGMFTDGFFMIKDDSIPKLKKLGFMKFCSHRKLPPDQYKLRKRRPLHNN